MIKTIFILWFQGFENAPYLVKRCVESWKYYNKDWNIILLDRTNLIEYIDISTRIDLTNKQLLLAHESDIIRLCLLEKYGGVWADATLFCNKPLDNWLPEYATKEFFAYSRPWPNLIISVWFFYSDVNSYIIKTWLDSLINYYKPRMKAHTYHIITYIFENLSKYNYLFKTRWNDITKISAIPCIYIQKKGFENQIDFEFKNHISCKQTPVYKLTYKDVHAEFNYNDININLSYLLSTIKNN
jgi:hypothetical protein